MTMRTETKTGGERREARMHWLRQMLDRPAAKSWEELIDEAVWGRFAAQEPGW